MKIQFLVTDLDGTITDPDGTVPLKVSEAFHRLEKLGVKTAVATGRSLHSTERLLGESFPLDYLIFSCGAGIFDWKSKAVAASFHLQREDIDRVIRYLMLGGFDFMVHKAIPNNHHFYYLGGGKGNADFARRCERNAEFAISGRLSFPVLTEASQFVVIESAERGEAQYERLKADLSPLSVIRTTSPLDHLSTWIEIFAPGVSKSQGAGWVSAKTGIAKEKAVAIGNDYNDEDLLEWAGFSSVVGNSPRTLLQKYPYAQQSHTAGFLEIIQNLWP